MSGNLFLQPPVPPNTEQKFDAIIICMSDILQEAHDTIKSKGFLLS